jgi:LysM domain
MNAAQALALPEDRGRNRPGRRPGSPRAALYLVPDPAAPSPAADRPAADRPAVPVPPIATSPLASSPPAGRLRLTRRGRVVIAAMAALLVTMLSLIAAAAAQATSHSVPWRAAGQHLIQVTVRPGQTLWSVAEGTDPDADPRLVVQRIVDLNGLKTDVIQPGEQLWVPRS